MSPGGADIGTPLPVKALGPAGPEVPKAGGPVPASVPKECTGAEDGCERAYMGGDGGGGGGDDDASCSNVFPLSVMPLRRRTKAPR